jgi:hypothetical protein
MTGDLESTRQGAENSKTVALRFDQEGKTALVEAAYRSMGIGKARRQWPIRREQIGRCDRAGLAEIAYFLIGEDSRWGPWKQIAAVDFNHSTWSGIGIGTDGRAVEGGEVGAAFQEAA